MWRKIVKHLSYTTGFIRFTKRDFLGEAGRSPTEKRQRRVKTRRRFWYGGETGEKLLPDVGILKNLNN